jgi:hypothetical protein
MRSIHVSLIENHLIVLARIGQASMPTAYAQRRTRTAHHLEMMVITGEQFALVEAVLFKMATH